MQILALQTNAWNIKKPFLHPGERELLSVHYHYFRFLLPALLQVSIISWIPTIPIFVELLIPLSFWAHAGAWTLTFVISSIALVITYTNVRFDFLFFTTDKLVIVDSSLIHQCILPVNMGSVTAISSETQFWNIFPFFGVLRIKIKSEAKTDPAQEISLQGKMNSVSTENDMVFRYVPYVQKVTAIINEILTDFQRRDWTMGKPLLVETALQTKDVRLQEIQEAKERLIAAKEQKHQSLTKKQEPPASEEPPVFTK